QQRELDVRVEAIARPVHAAPHDEDLALEEIDGLAERHRALPPMRRRMSGQISEWETRRELRREGETEAVIRVLALHVNAGLLVGTPAVPLDGPVRDVDVRELARWRGQRLVEETDMQGH